MSDKVAGPPIDVETTRGPDGSPCPREGMAIDRGMIVTAFSGVIGVNVREVVKKSGQHPREQGYLDSG